MRVELRGFVDDVREPLGALRRVRLPDSERLGRSGETARSICRGNPGGLDAHWSGGSGARRRRVCALADDPRAFADQILGLFDHPEEAAEMARRARAEVEANWDMPTITRRLADSYHRVARAKRGA